jgi:hypothetical protein
MKPCIHLDYEQHFAQCELCSAAPHFPNVRYWKRLVLPFEEAPVKVQFCKLRGRINDIFSCYNGEQSCYEPSAANTVEGVALRPATQQGPQETLNTKE